jgi:hypothetical protein
LQFGTAHVALGQKRTPLNVRFTPKAAVVSAVILEGSRLRSFPSSCRRACNSHSACLQAHRLARRGGDKRSSRSKPDIDAHSTDRCFLLGKIGADPSADSDFWKTETRICAGFGEIDTLVTLLFDDMG